MTSTRGERWRARFAVARLGGSVLVAALLAACTILRPPEGLSRKPFAECEPKAWGGWHVVWPTADTSGALEVAWWWTEQGLPGRAVLTLDAALDYLPDDPTLLEARGALYHAMRFHRAAEIDFQRVAAARPEEASVWRALGTVRLAMALPDRALAAIDRGRALGDRSPASFELEARALRAAGRSVPAWRAYERAIRGWGEPVPDLYLETATLALPRAGRRAPPHVLSRARELAELALRVEDEAPEAWLVHALVLEAAGDEEEAGKSYRRSGELDPGGTSGWTFLARLGKGLGDGELLPEAVSRAAALESEDGRAALYARLSLTSP